MTVVKILERHITNGVVPIHYNTLYQFLKESDFVFKRTRHPAKKRNETNFDECSLEIIQLNEDSQAGKIELVYVDGAGLSCIHPNRKAWKKRRTASHSGHPRRKT